MWEPLTAQGKHGNPRLQWIEYGDFGAAKMAILGRRLTGEGYRYSTILVRALRPLPW